MKNKIKTCIMIIVVLVVASIMVWFAHKIIMNADNTTNQGSSEINNIKEINEVANYLVDNTENTSNKIENTAEEKTEEDNNNEEEKNTENEKTSDTTTKNSNTGVSNEDRAISIVKKNWGSEEGVYFTTMGIDAKGRYIVTVNDSSTTAIYASYAVNIETEEFEVQ